MIYDKGAIIGLAWAFALLVLVGIAVRSGIPAIGSILVSIGCYLCGYNQARVNYAQPGMRKR